jgi:hypothetical protein
VAVILNALRALHAGRAATPMTRADAALTRRFQGEHEVIRADIEELRATADSLGFTTPGEAMARVRRAYHILADEIGPHEQAEERELYPALDRMLGSPEATTTMSRGHAGIAHQARRLGQLIDDIGSEPPDEADLADLRSTLYGLHAILRLHTTQEDESYLSLVPEAREPQPHPPALIIAWRAGPLPAMSACRLRGRRGCGLLRPSGRFPASAQGRAGILYLA